MPEDTHPQFDVPEIRLAYFTLPMALNYQRDSYKLWEAALKTHEDAQTSFVFNLSEVSKRSEEELRKALVAHKLALQPNKHIRTWRTITDTVNREWGSFEALMQASGGDFLTLRHLVQVAHKQGFPYLSGPKIFNYWSFILSTYGGIRLKNRQHISIAPDTHITQCSIRLGVISPEEAETLSKEVISERWHDLLSGSDIDAIDMHPPLWFWSRNGFIYRL